MLVHVGGGCGCPSLRARDAVSRTPVSPLLVHICRLYCLVPRALDQGAVPLSEQACQSGIVRWTSATVTVSHRQPPALAAGAVGSLTQLPSRGGPGLSRCFSDGSGEEGRRGGYKAFPLAVGRTESRRHSEGWFPISSLQMRCLGKEVVRRHPRLGRDGSQGPALSAAVG